MVMFLLFFVCVDNIYIMALNFIQGGCWCDGDDSFSAHSVCHAGPILQQGGDGEEEPHGG